jgi:hypothetical protein
MSGGSGSSSGSGFGGDRGTDCAALRFDAFLSSVDPAVLESVKEKDVLAIELRTTPTPVLVAVVPSGEALGAITRKVRELLRCIQQQVRFEATVKNISGGNVEVGIAPV